MFKLLREIKKLLREIRDELRKSNEPVRFIDESHITELNKNRKKAKELKVDSSKLLEELKTIVDKASKEN